MGKTRKRKPSIGDAQRQIAVLAEAAERLTNRVQELGEELDETLSQAQAQGLEAETLKTHVAAWLLTTDDVPLYEVADRLERLARLRQEDVDAAWKARFPVVLAEEAERQLEGLREHAAAVVAAASRGDELLVVATLQTLCRQMEDGGPELDDLVARCRRYLGREA